MSNRTKQHLNLTPTVTRLQFVTHAQAQQAFSQLQVAHNWQPPQNDTSTPNTQRNREYYCQIR